MQINFKKEYDFLTKTHKVAFRHSIQSYFGIHSAKPFYAIINGERNLTPLQRAYILQELFFYHDIQKRCGKVYCDIDINIA